jgi:peptide/nickel transport system ATP-binding protein
MSAPPVLDIEDLHVEIRRGGQATPILRGVDLSVPQRSVHGLVGESGGGKTMVGKTILDVLPTGARITRGALRFAGRDLLAMAARERRDLLGRSIAGILQNPMTALNPVLRIEGQMTDMLRWRLGCLRREARRRALEMLAEVQIRDPERVLRLYPHELSGGMCQRIAIAVAFSGQPELIIADEPTTALDVTVQFQILRLIRRLQERFKTTVLFISHDLGVVAKLCDFVSVMHAGRILEAAAVGQIFAHPQHPYTAALFAATPRYDRPRAALRPVPAELHTQLWAEARRYDAGQSDARRLDA